MKIGLRVTVYQGMIVLLSVLVLTVILRQGQGETITVDDNGDADHSSIQEAVDEAQDGDTILIYSGDYSENIQVRKRVTITGEDRDTTRITGKDNAYVLEILHDGVNLSGLSIVNGDTRYNVGGLYIEADDAEISDLNISVTGTGMYLYHADGNDLQRNHISTGNSNAIWLYHSDENMIHRNSVYDNRYGIYLSYARRNILHNNSVIDQNDYGFNIVQSYQNQLYDNICTGNNFGIRLYESTDTTIERNTCSGNMVGISVNEGYYSIQDSLKPPTMMTNNSCHNNTEDGIHLYQSYKVHVENNSCDNNGGSGIHLEISRDNIIHNNTCRLNEYGIFHEYSTTALLANNSFQGNVLQDNAINFHDKLNGYDYYDDYDEDYPDDPWFDFCLFCGVPTIFIAIIVVVIVYQRRRSRHRPVYGPYYQYPVGYSPPMYPYYPPPSPPVPYYPPYYPPASPPVYYEPPYPQSIPPQIPHDPFYAYPYPPRIPYDPSYAYPYPQQQGPPSNDYHTSRSEQPKHPPRTTSPSPFPPSPQRRTPPQQSRSPRSPPTPSRPFDMTRPPDAPPRTFIPPHTPPPPSIPQPSHSLFPTPPQPSHSPPPPTPPPAIPPQEPASSFLENDPYESQSIPEWQRLREEEDEDSMDDDQPHE